MMTICIRQGLKEINEELKLLNREEFKLLYSLTILSLLSVLNVFRRSCLMRESSGVNLSDPTILTEDVGCVIGRLLKERSNLIDMVDEKSHPSETTEVHIKMHINWLVCLQELHQTVIAE